VAMSLQSAIDNFLLTAGGLHDDKDLSLRLQADAKAFNLGKAYSR